MSVHLQILLRLRRRVLFGVGLQFNCTSGTRRIGVYDYLNLNDWKVVAGLSHRGKAAQAREGAVSAIKNVCLGQSMRSGAARGRVQYPCLGYG